MEANPHVTVYLLNSFPDCFKHKVKGYGADMVEIQDAVKICEHVYSSGELGEKFLEEQALLLHTDTGVIVIIT